MFLNREPSYAAVASGSGIRGFCDDRRLSEAQIQLIKTWARLGAPEGPPGDAPRVPQFSGGWQLGKPDLVIEATREVSIPASGPDVFWNFVFSPNIKTVRYVRAIEINPGSGVDLVHHANVILDPARTGRRQESSPGAGFLGMDLMLATVRSRFRAIFCSGNQGPDRGSNLTGWPGKLKTRHGPCTECAFHADGNVRGGKAFDRTLFHR